jgi:ElaB/YqjD/DUF883 family membrane-anchored ribosome-binding protein
MEAEGEDIMNSRSEVCDLASDLKKVITDSEQALAAAAGEKVEALKAELTGLVENAREVCGKLEKQTKQCVAAADNTIRDHPYQSIGVAAAVGLIIGVLIARK